VGTDVCNGWVNGGLGGCGRWGDGEMGRWGDRELGFE